MSGHANIINFIMVLPFPFGYCFKTPLDKGIGPPLLHLFFRKGPIAIITLYMSNFPTLKRIYIT